MTTPEPSDRDDGPSPDPLLRRAQEMVEKARPDPESAMVKHEQGPAAAFIQRLIDACVAFVRMLGWPFRWLASVFRGSLMRRLAAALAWAAFEREDGRFRLDAEGRRIFSGSRLVGSGLILGVIVSALYVSLCAAYFYGTRFEELVYTTGKQEIEVGELYQFTGCTVLPCNTEADNGKYYKVESSLFLPTLLYPEQDVFANIPQQNAACHVKGYGYYFRNLRWLYKYAQWYQKVYDISCRPYNEQELAKASTLVLPQ